MERQPTPPASIGVEHRCLWHIEGCDTAQDHTGHANATTLARTPELAHDTLSSLIVESRDNTDVFVALAKRDDLTVTQLDTLHAARIPRSQPHRFLKVFTLSEDPDDIQAGHDTRCEALLARDDITVKRLNMLATWTPLSSAAINAVLTHPRAQHRTGFICASSQIPGSNADNCTDAIAATDNWHWRAGAAIAATQQQRKLTANGLSRHATRLAKRTGRTPLALELVEGLAPGWGLDIDSLINTVTALSSPADTT